MNKFGLSLAAAVTVGACNFAVANYNNVMYDFCPYVGADFKYWHISLADDYHDGGIFGNNNSFGENYYGGAVFLGVRWCRMIGLEVGYEASDKRNRDFTVPGSTVLFGDLLSADPNASIIINTKVQIRGPYLDLHGYFPIYNCLDLIGTIGIAHIDPRVDVLVDTLDRAADGDGKVIFRAGGGFQYMFSDYIGARALVRWEDTSRIRVNVYNAAGTATTELRPFNDAVSATLGFFVTFF